MKFLLQIPELPVSAGEIMKITPWTAGGYGLALLILIAVSYVFYKQGKDSAKSERETIIEITKFMPVMLSRLDINEDTRNKIAVILNDMPLIKADLSEVRRLIEELNRNSK